jgi:hypothetical protein
MTLSDRFNRPPIIIGGCGRSGTSLLLSVLSAHPHIFAFPRETRTLCPTAYTRGSLDLQAPFQFEELRGVLQSLPVKESAVRWCEKTPKNILFFGRLLQHFGSNVRMINMVRDGRDVITSRHPNDPTRSWIGLDRWIQDVGAGVAFDGHPQVLVVKYEDLVLKFDETVRSICAFLGEEVDDALVAWHANTTVRDHPAFGGDVTEVHGQSIGKWRHDQYRGLIAEMMADREAVDLLRHYGYVAGDAKPIGAWRPDFLMRRMLRKVPSGLKMSVKQMFRRPQRAG